MDRLKPFFIVFAVWYCLLSAAISCYFFSAEGFNPATLGMALVSVLPVAFFFGLNIANKPRTSPSQIILSLVVLGGYLLIWTDYPDLGTVLLILFGINFGLWLLYVHWYSYLPVPESTVLVPGNTVPEMQFTTYRKKPFYASSLLGKKVVYLFYRGNWCPVDMAQIKELTRQFADFSERGAEVLLISPQPFSETKKLAEKLGVDFRFLTDIDNKMARLLEIENKFGVPKGIGMGKYKPDTVYPTVFITDEMGRIIYVDQTTNYRVRPEPQEYMAALDTA